MGEGSVSSGSEPDFQGPSASQEDEAPIGPAPLDVVKQYQDQDQIVVDMYSELDGVHNTISSALAVVPEGGTIVVFPGLYEETLAITSKTIIKGVNWREDGHWRVIVSSTAGVAIRCQCSGVIIQGIEVMERCNYNLPSNKREFGQSPCCIGVSGDNSLSLIECRMHGHGAALLCTGNSKVVMKSCRLPKPVDQQTSCRFSAVIALHNSEVYIENCEFKHVRAPLITCLHKAKCTVRESDLLTCHSNAIHASDQSTVLVEKCNINENEFSALYCDGNAACLLKECLIEGNGNGVTCRGESRVVGCSIKDCDYSAVSCDNTSSCDVSECRIDIFQYGVLALGMSKVELQGCQLRNTRLRTVSSHGQAVVTLRQCDVKHSHTVFAGDGESVINSFGCFVSYTRHDVVFCEEDCVVTMRQSGLNTSLLGKKKKTGASMASRAASEIMSEATSVFTELKVGARVPALSIVGSIADFEQGPESDREVEVIRKRESKAFKKVEEADELDDMSQVGVAKPALLRPGAVESPRGALPLAPVFEEDEAASLSHRTQSYHGDTYRSQATSAAPPALAVGEGDGDKAKPKRHTAAELNSTPVQEKRVPVNPKIAERVTPQKAAPKPQRQVISRAPSTPKSNPATPKSNPGTPKSNPGTPKSNPRTPKASNSPGGPRSPVAAARASRTSVRVPGSPLLARSGSGSESKFARRSSGPGLASPKKGLAAAAHAASSPVLRKAEPAARPSRTPVRNASPGVVPPGRAVVTPSPSRPASRAPVKSKVGAATPPPAKGRVAVVSSPSVAARPAAGHVRVKSMGSSPARPPAAALTPKGRSSPSSPAPNVRSPLGAARRASSRSAK